MTEKMHEAQTRKPNDQLYLGIDPGFDRVGWAIGTLPQQTVKLVAGACIRTDSALPLLERYRDLLRQLRTIIARYKPKALVIEELFFFRNRTTIVSVSQARGLILGACLDARMDIIEYTPLEIKHTVAGHGAATKTEMGRMIQKQVDLASLTETMDDTIDAVALLLTHSIRKSYRDATGI